MPDELKPIGQDAVRALTDGIEETKAGAVAAAAADINRDSDKGDAVINIDGKEFYRATLSSLRAVEDETPRVLDDK